MEPDSIKRDFDRLFDWFVHKNLSKIAYGLQTSLRYARTTKRFAGIASSPSTLLNKGLRF